ncbi:MAG: hypothetical protein WC028_30640 [Candidatus Obscuribacterales bacterium]
MKAFRTLLALLAGIGSACFMLSASAADAAGEVVYRFPDVANLGTLETRIGDRPGAVALDRIASRRHTVASARGIVKLTAAQNRAVYFAPGVALIRRPELMDAISPDNILGFYFSFTSTGDSEDAIADQLVAKISHLKNLRIVRIGRCDVSDIGVKSLRGLPQLKILDISYTLITGKSMPVIGRLTNLEDLTMNSVDLRQSDFSYIARLPKLSALYLRGAQVSDAMVMALKSSKSLENIDLSNNRAITDASLPALALLPNLKAVCLAGTSVNLQSLTKLARVKRVVLSDRDLKGASFEVLKKTLPNLALDNYGKKSSSESRPGAEEMHLFAPTRY